MSDKFDKSFKQVEEKMLVGSGVLSKGVDKHFISTVFKTALHGIYYGINRKRGKSQAELFLSNPDSETFLKVL